MNALRPTSYYDEHALTLDPTEITSSGNNAEILRRVRDDDPELTSLSIQQRLWLNHEDYVFVVGDGDDLGWLGYFIRRNKVLTRLYIRAEDRDREQITALLRVGIEQSKSIRELCISGDHNELSSLSARLQSESCCLTSLVLHNIPLVDDEATALADALKACKSLTDLRLGLGFLTLGESVLNSLSAMLRSEICSLTSLSLGSTCLVSDDAAVALADALKGNKSLKYLLFNTDDLTPVGLSAFSELLCDTSSVSNTYASNHTLQEIGSYFYIYMTRSNYPQDVKQLLALNGLPDKHAAIQKILKYHDFDVGPFLVDKSKRKLLPLVMSWFERVSRQQAERSESVRFIRGILVELVSTEEIQKRQLSTMCKIVRSMPLEAIDGYRRFSVGKELQEPKVGRHTYRSYSSHKKRKFDLLGRNFHTLVLLCLLTLVLPLL